jgi:hypothetical protein
MPDEWTHGGDDTGAREKKTFFFSSGYDFKNFVVKNKKNEETYNGANLE